MHSRTRSALVGTDAVFHRLDRNDDRAYWSLLARVWVAGGPLVVVEHDVEIHPGVLPGFEQCPEPWCTYPTQRPLPGPHSTWSGQDWSPGIPLWEKALGCARFSAELLCAEPDVIEVLCTKVIGGSPPGHWRRMDDGIAIELEARGYRVCVHHPEVTHHHDLRPRWDACTCGEACG